jgi:hypothetical protein
VAAAAHRTPPKPDRESAAVTRHPQPALDGAPPVAPFPPESAPPLPPESTSRFPPESDPVSVLPSPELPSGDIPASDGSPASIPPPITPTPANGTSCGLVTPDVLSVIFSRSVCGPTAVGEKSTVTEQLLPELSAEPHVLDEIENWVPIAGLGVKRSRPCGRGQCHRMQSAPLVQRQPGQLSFVPSKQSSHASGRPLLKWPRW